MTRALPVSMWESPRVNIEVRHCEFEVTPERLKRKTRGKTGVSLIMAAKLEFFLTLEI